MVPAISRKSVSSVVFFNIEEINWNPADRRNLPVWAAGWSSRLSIEPDCNTYWPRSKNSANILAAEPSAAADFRDPLSRECAESSE